MSESMDADRIASVFDLVHSLKRAVNCHQELYKKAPMASREGNWYRQLWEQIDYHTRQLCELPNEVVQFQLRKYTRTWWEKPGALVEIRTPFSERVLAVPVYRLKALRDDGALARQVQQRLIYPHGAVRVRDWQLVDEKRHPETELLCPECEHSISAHPYGLYRPVIVYNKGTESCGIWALSGLTVMYRHRLGPCKHRLCTCTGTSME